MLQGTWQLARQGFGERAASEENRQQSINLLELGDRETGLDNFLFILVLIGYFCLGYCLRWFLTDKTLTLSLRVVWR